MNIISVVFENGIEVYRTEDDLWHISSVHNKDLNMTPMEVVKKYNIRPVLATERTFSHNERVFLLSNQADINIDGITELKLPIHTTTEGIRDNSTLFPIFNHRYVVGATYYHCKQLVEIHKKVCRDFARTHPTEQYEKTDRVTYGFQMEVYYEFDALLTSAHRAYETARYVIWQAFGKNNGQPRNFLKTVDACDNIPVALLERLKSSWDQFGNRLKEYRDCILHYVPINHLIPYVQMIKLPYEVWSISALIPDNPEVRSQNKFNYDSDINMLTYGWELTNEILDVSQAIVNEVKNHTITG